MKISKLEPCSFDLISTFARKVPNKESENSLLRKIGASLLCESGTFWRVNSAHHSSDSFVTWNTDGVLAPKLELRTKERRLLLSEENTGHVSKMRKAVWNTEIVEDMCILHSSDATVSVAIEILGKNPDSTTDELMLHMESIEIPIGDEIEKKADDNIRNF